MGIDRSLLNEFIKITNDKKETKQTQLYGTVVTQGNSKYVKIDGSEIITPVRSTTDIKDDERVIVKIDNHMATITGNMTNPSVGNDRVEFTEGKIDRFDHLFAGNITAENIAANSITSDKILAGSITTDKLMAESIIADKIAADAIESKHIKANAIEAEHIKAGAITADKIDAGIITSDHISSGTITADKIATGTITAGSGVIADGAIGNAQISSLDVAKLESGTIDTSKIYIAGADGHLQLKGNRLQVFDGLGNRAVERVSVGDVNGDGSKFGLRVRGADGETILLDENGVTSEGITDGSITNNKISDDANIDGAKLNINSVVSKINEDGTEVIKGTKISVNGTNLETKLSSIETTQSTQGSTISQHSSKILANEKAIALKVDRQTYTTDKNNMTTQLNKNTSAIDVLQDEITLKVEQTDINQAKTEMGKVIDSKISSAKADIKITTDAITQNVSNLTQTVSNKADGSTVSTLSNKVGSLETSVNGISGKVSSLETSNTTLNNKVNTAQNTANANKTNISSLQTEVSTVKNNVASLDVTTSGISQKVSSLQSTTTTLTNKVDTAQNTANSVNSKIDNLEIGGRNYALGTQAFISKAGENKENQGVNLYSLNKGFAGNTVTTSFDWEVTGNIISGKFYTQLNASPWTNFSESIIVSSTNKKGRVVCTQEVPLDLGSANMIKARLDNFQGILKISSLKIEIGNKATDWSPAPEDVSQDATNKSNQALTDAKNYTNTQITTVNNKVASIQTDLNGITSRVTNTENNIKTTNNNVTSLTNRVATAESKITESAITNTVKKNFYTKTETDSQITSKGYQTASQVQQTVNGLEVKVTQSGGYNLLRNTGFRTGDLKGWWICQYNNPVGSYGFLTHTDEWGFPDSTVKTVQLRMANQTGVEYGLAQKFDTAIGKKYTISFYYASHRCSKANIIIRNTNGTWLGNKNFNPSSYGGGKTSVTNWGKISYTFTAKESNHTLNIVLNDAQNDGYMWIAKPVIEEGSLATEYSPHPSEIYDGITTIDKDGVTVKQSNISTYTTMDASSFRVENNTGGTIAEFSQNSQIPNLTAGVISANEVYANNVVRKSTYVKNYYVAGGYGNDKEGAGGSWSNPCKTVQYVLDNYIEDILDYDVNIYVGESVPGWTCKSKSGKGVISFLIQNDCIVRDPLYLDNCTNRVVVNGYAEKKGTFMTGIVVTGCHNFDIGWVSFRGKNWAHSKGSCNIFIRDGSKGLVRFNDFNGCSFAIIVENNSELWVFGNRGSDITHYIGISSYTTIYGMRSGTDTCPDFTGYYYADAGHSNLYHIHDGANYTKTPSIGWSPSYTPTQKTQTWSFNKIWSDETLHGWSDRQELIQGYASTWNTGRWTGYMQMTDDFSGIRNTISGGTNLSGRIYIQRTSSSGNSTGSKLCLYGSDGTLITNSTSINRSQGVWVSLSSSIIQKIQSGAIRYFYLKADANNSSTYFKCERNCKIEITYTK